ncbi:MAG: formimidoylglutamate deiminase [Aestuariivita sp.]|nr:formimidoylglutamate deiminase [Aestuariivita sp.]
MFRVKAHHALTSDGWKDDIDVTVTANGRIADISPQHNAAAYEVDILLPAPVNLHSHAFQRALSGLTEGPSIPEDNFWTWRQLMYKFLEQLTPERIEAIAEQAFMEMAEAGYASVVEFHYLHHNREGHAYTKLSETSERIMSAALSTGVGLTLLPVLYEYGGCDHRELDGSQKRFGNTKKQFEELFLQAQDELAHGPEDWVIGAASHSLRAVDCAGLALAHELTGSQPYHIHLAEQTSEVSEVKSYLGCHPVEWMLNNFPIDARCCFIHCTQMTSEETRELAKSNAIVGLCPITEANLGDGHFKGDEFLQHAGCYGIGTDSNVQIGLWEELKMLEYSQRLHHKRRSVLRRHPHSTGRSLFEAALTGGARASGRQSEHIKEGGWADMIGIRKDNEFLVNRDSDSILDSLIFSGAGSRCLCDVWSAGRHIVKNGCHIERTRIVTNFTRTLKELEESL